MVNINDMIMPALIAGVVIGLGSSIVGFIIGLIPCVGCLNFLLCFVWPLAAGFAAAYMLSKKQVDTQSGVIVGALAGLVGGIVSVVIGLMLFALNALFGIGLNFAAPGAGMKQGLAQAGAATAAVGLIGVPLMIFSTVVSLVIWVVFGAVGGLIGTMVAGKK